MPSYFICQNCTNSLTSINILLKILICVGGTIQLRNMKIDLLVFGAKVNIFYIILQMLCSQIFYTFLMFFQTCTFQKPKIIYTLESIQGPPTPICNQHLSVSGQTTCPKVIKDVHLQERNIKLQQQKQQHKQHNFKCMYPCSPTNILVLCL